MVIQLLKPNISKFQESKLHWLEVEALAFRRMMILLSEKNQLVRVRVHFHFVNIHSDVSTLIILLGSSVYASSRTRKWKDCKILFMIINNSKSQFWDWDPTINIYLCLKMVRTHDNDCDSSQLRDTRNVSTLRGHDMRHTTMQAFEGKLQFWANKSLDVKIPKKTVKLIANVILMKFLFLSCRYAIIWYMPILP